MDYYLDIRVLPDPEFKETVLMNALFAKLHRGLGQYAEGRVGVSFPDHHQNLGAVLRLHGTAADLDALMARPWLKGLRDYCQCGDITAVPEACQYRTVRRIQAKTAHNKRKRSINKGWLTEEEAFAKIPDTQQRRLTLPYAQLISLSNKNTMRIYVEHGPVSDAAATGMFSSYGLSAAATVPWF